MNGRTGIEQVRDLMPRCRSLTEAYGVAERQAYTLLDLLDIRAPHVTYDKLLKPPNVDIIFEPDYLLEHISSLILASGAKWSL